MQDILKQISIFNILYQNNVFGNKPDITKITIQPQGENRYCIFDPETQKWFDYAIHIELEMPMTK